MNGRSRVLAGRTLALLTAAALLTGCGTVSSNTGNGAAKDDGTDPGSSLSIVTTIFPVYDWTRTIAGDAVPADSITFLTGQGVDMHSYLPSAKDMAAILDADLVIYIGGESDGWLAEALAANPDPERRELALMEAIGNRALEEEIVEGMESEHAHDHEEDHAEDHAEDHEGEIHEHEDGPENDEHIWLSLRNAEICCESIADVLTELLPGSSETIGNGLALYLERLQMLDKQYEERLAEAEHNTLLFGDRFPFRYLTEDYGLEYYAAFSGCYADAEAGFSTVTFLAGKLDELSIPCVLVIDGSDRKLAQTIIDNSADHARRILEMDSMQSVTADRVSAGLTYIGAMEDNLDVLGEALGAVSEAED